MSSQSVRKLLVKPKTGMEMIDARPTKFWELVKTGKIKMVRVGRSDMVVVASLERLAAGEAA